MRRSAGFSEAGSKWPRSSTSTKERCRSGRLVPGRRACGCGLPGRRGGGRITRRGRSARVGDRGRPRRGRARGPQSVGTGDVAALWRWREGVAFAAAAVRGGKVAEDVAVPLDRLAEIIDGTVEIGARHGLQAISWGHAGDGNVHSNFLVDPGDQNEVERADRAVEELFDLTVALGGTISGEHGLGWLKRGQLEKQWSPRAMELHRAVKQVFDPKNLLNPGKKN